MYSLYNYQAIGIIWNLYVLYIYMSQISCRNLTETAFIMQKLWIINWRYVSVCGATLNVICYVLWKCDTTRLHLFTTVLLILPQIALKLKFIYCPTALVFNRDWIFSRTLFSCSTFVYNHTYCEILMSVRKSKRTTTIDSRKIEMKASEIRFLVKICTISNNKTEKSSFWCLILMNISIIRIHLTNTKHLTQHKKSPWCVVRFGDGIIFGPISRTDSKLKCA